MFGPWSIYSEAYDRDRTVVRCTEDEGIACYAVLCLRDAVELGALLERRGLSFDDYFEESPYNIAG